MRLMKECIMKKTLEEERFPVDLRKTKVLFHWVRKSSVDYVQAHGITRDRDGFIYLSEKPLRTSGGAIFYVRIPENERKMHLYDWREFWYDENGESSSGEGKEYDPKNPYYIFADKDIPKEWMSPYTTRDSFQLDSARGIEMKTIKIEEEFQIPGSDIVLEKDDRIVIKESSRSVSKEELLAYVSSKFESGRQPLWLSWQSLPEGGFAGTMNGTLKIFRTSIDALGRILFYGHHDEHFLIAPKYFKHFEIYDDADKVLLSNSAIICSIEF